MFTALMSMPVVPSMKTWMRPVPSCIQNALLKDAVDSESTSPTAVANVPTFS